MKERAEARRVEVARFRAALPELQSILEQSTKIESKAKDALKKMPVLQDREGMISALAVSQVSELVSAFFFCSSIFLGGIWLAVVRARPWGALVSKSLDYGRRNTTMKRLLYSRTLLLKRLRPRSSSDCRVWFDKLVKML